jgi:hypothetical protein
LGSQWTPRLLFIKDNDFVVAQLVYKVNKRPTAPGKSMEIGSYVVEMGSS